jgi:hypothetical protein
MCDAASNQVCGNRACISAASQQHTEKVRRVMMSTLLLHPYEYLRMHVHPAMIAEGVKPRASYLRELLSFAEGVGKIALLISMAYLAFICFERISTSVILSAHYCDMCAAPPVMLVAP